MSGAAPRPSEFEEGRRGSRPVATRALQAGSVIFTEHPLFLITREMKAEVGRLLEAYHRLPGDTKERLERLHDPGETYDKFDALPEIDCGDRKVLRILDVNTYGSEVGESSGVYEVISRINHSCWPNVHYTVVAARGMEVRACRPVAPGEELVASYLGQGLELATREARVGETVRRWAFTCRSPILHTPLARCRLCSLTGEALERNEEARRRIQACCRAILALTEHCRASLAGGSGGLVWRRLLALAELRLALMEEIEEQVIFQLPFAHVECHNFALAGGLVGAAEEHREAATRRALDTHIRGLAEEVGECLEEAARGVVTLLRWSY